MEKRNTYTSITEIALTKFPQIVEDATIIKGPLNTPKSVRIFLHEGSFLEVWISGDKYSYHRERRKIDGKLYRHDNAPHHKEIKTYPKYLHSKTENNVKESRISDKPEIAIVEFLEFIKKKIKQT